MDDTERTSMRASYLHTIDEERSRINGVHERMLRLLSTALEANDVNPPRSGVIQERVEDCVEMLRAELRRPPRWSQK